MSDEQEPLVDGTAPSGNPVGNAVKGAANKGIEKGKEKTKEALKKQIKKKMKKEAGKQAAKTAGKMAMSGPLMYYLFWAAVVIVCIIIIIGIIMFIVTLPGLVMGKLKEFCKALGNYLAAFFGADTSKQIDDEQIYETLDYLENMGFDLKGEGFLTGYMDEEKFDEAIDLYRNDEDAFDDLDNKYSDLIDEKGDDLSFDDAQGLVRDSNDKIVLAESDFINTYIISENYIYTIKNENLVTQNDGSGFWGKLWGGIKACWQKVTNFVLGPVFSAIGLYDNTVESWGRRNACILL